MDNVMRVSVLSIVIGTVVVCWLAVWMVFSGRFYYFTEHTSEERLHGMVKRLNAQPLFQSDDGAENLGYFLVPKGVQRQIKMPADFDGEFGTVELPPEASHLPNDFLALVQMNVCNVSKSIEYYVDDDVFYEVVFLDTNERPIERVRGDSPECRLYASQWVR